MEKFTIGLLLGGIGGALLAANSKEMENGGSVFGGGSENNESGEKMPEKSESQGQGKDDGAKERGK